MKAKRYHVYEHPDMGYALFAWLEDAQFWQQCSNWYMKRGNLARFAKKHYGIEI